jgi:hypothetical protein
MRKNDPFRLNRSGVMLAVVSAAFVGEAGAAAGRAEFTIGGVTVAGRDGVERPLARGTELDNGDTVRTKDGRAQIRFIDGAYVSLQPNTEFGIREYRYENKTDGNERGFFGLLKGAMRTVTGAIGRVNRDRYQISTPTATVGIRGTGGVIQVQDDGSTLVIGTSGIWSLTNPAGSVDVPAGTSALAPTDPNQPPQESTEPPTSGPAPVQEEEPEFVAGEERTATGDPVIPAPTVLMSGGGFAAALAYTAFEGPQLDGGEFRGFQLSDAVFDSAGRLTSITDSGSGGTIQSASLDTANGGRHALRPDGTEDFGTDGILAWGRWVGQVNFVSGSPFSETYSDNSGFHYVVGTPTAVLPTNVIATYSLLGATVPTNGSSTGTVLGGSLSVNFGAASYDISLVNFDVQMSSATYRLNGTARVLTTPYFTMSPSVGIVAGSGCSCSCSAGAVGFFAGTNAERAGMSYHINDSFTNTLGAAAFKKD